jgi:hypothetical protein
LLVQLFHIVLETCLKKFCKPSVNSWRFLPTSATAASRPTIAIMPLSKTGAVAACLLGNRRKLRQRLTILTGNLREVAERVNAQVAFQGEIRFHVQASTMPLL